jgi:glycosyltransferase involved in cell wall biosynthesis
VIVARIGGIPEIIDDGRKGLLFTSGDSAGLTRAMATLIEMDGVGIEVMGRSAHRGIETEYNCRTAL